jgi:hypothetical protein
MDVGTPEEGGSAMLKGLLPSRWRAVSALAVAAALLGTGANAGAATVAAAESTGTLTPSTLDLGIIYHYQTAHGTITYTNPGTGPVAISRVEITGDIHDRWGIADDECSTQPVAAGGACTVEVSFFASVSSWFFTSSATITFVDAPTGGTSGTLIARVAPRPSAEDWSQPLPVRGSGTNAGGGLARTTSATAEYLHVVYSGATVYGIPVADGGPYRPVAYTRSITDGATWRAPQRLNPSNRHGTDPTVAGSGSTVYAAWIDVAHASTTGDGPRILYVRVNSTYGIGQWRTAVRLSPSSGRVMGPRVAAAGSYAYVAYTDASTGSVKVAVSRNRGASWATTTLGSTTRGSSGARDAGVGIAADGSQVLVTWLSSTSGTVKARASLNGGSTWASTATVGTGADAGTSTSATIRGTAGAVAWVDGATVGYAATKSGARITSSSWTLGTYGVDYLPRAYLGVRSVAAAIRSVGHVSVAIEACYGSCDPASVAYRTDILWREAAYLSSQVVIGSVDGSRSVARPSVVYATSTLRYVLTTTQDAGTGTERLVLSAGIGTP